MDVRGRKKVGAVRASSRTGDIPPGRHHCTAAPLASFPPLHLRMKGPQSAQSLLGGRTPAAFMSQHWQKKPLLIRHAFPEFNGGLSRDRLIALACSDDVESRLVIRERRRFSVAMG